MMVAALVFGSQAAQAAEEGLHAVTVKFKIMLGGKQLKLDKDPIVIDGSTYLPLRAIGEALGKDLYWNADSETITMMNTPVVKGVFEWKNPPELGKGIKEGGFSGLLHIPTDPDNVFYTVADRGPNGDPTINGKKFRTFPIEGFTPRIYKIKLDKSEIQILETIKLQLPAGKLNTVTKNTYLTGLPNINGIDEVPYDETATTKLAYDVDGLDLEGIAYNPMDDTFWLSDEYSPSLVQVKRDGTVIARHIPQGMKEKLAGSMIPLLDTLPAIYAKRVNNRGFEGVTITPDGKYLYASMQSAMLVPDKKASETSRSLRVLKMDLSTKEIIGEYVYIAEDATKFVKVAQKDVVISDLHAISENVLLVDERDKNEGKAAQIKRIYRADFTSATNILGTETSAALESWTVEQLKTNGIVSVVKMPLVDLTKLAYPYEKLEGLAVVGKRQIVVTNDNDFGISYDDKTKLTFTNTPTQVQVIELSEDLK